MNYLLDTHSIIWYLTEPWELSEIAKNAIQNDENECFVSIASFWEIAIKTNIGKLEFELSFDEIELELEKHSIKMCPLHIEFLKCYQTLPLLHKDPFDRIIIATAMSCDWEIISKDPLIKLYQVKSIW